MTAEEASRRLSCYLGENKVAPAQPDRCSRHHPCEAYDPHHMMLWGECWFRRNGALNHWANIPGDEVVGGEAGGA